MPIRQRIAAVQASPPKPKPVKQERMQVPVLMRKAEDRGRFEFGKDPYEGSSYEAMGVPGDNEGRSVVALSAYVYKPPLPKEMTVQDLLVQLRMPDNPVCSVERAYRKRVRSPLTAIRAACVECQGGSPRAVNKCDVTSCVLWPFRMGQNGLRGATDDDAS